MDDDDPASRPTRDAGLGIQRSEQPNVSAEINAATRQLHTHLNRLITSRLPLAIPPHAKDSQTYAHGLQHFAHVYLTFESLWQDLRSSTGKVKSPALSTLLEDPWVAVSREPNGSNSESQMATTQLSNFLAHVLPPGLERSKRLRNDLAILFGLNAVDLDVLLARFPGSKVHEYAAHIRQVVADKPHVLVAYAWVMYMAIFSGGRWMRQQLCSAGQEFWTAKGVGSSPGEAATRNDNLSVHNPGLSFFDFEGDLDGEDIKAAFKLRLQDAEGLLTSSQRQDIIEEAKEIFRYSIALVEELDDLLRTPCDTDVNLVDGVQSSTKGHPVRPKLTFTWTRPNEAWLYAQGITGFAFVVSCISWYAYYHATS